VHIERGMLIAKRIVVGANAIVGIKCILTPGAVVHDDQVLASTATVDGHIGSLSPNPRPRLSEDCRWWGDKWGRSRGQALLHMLVGIPCVLAANAALFTLAFALIDALLEPLYEACGVVAPADSLFGDLLGISRTTDGFIPLTPKYVLGIVVGGILQYSIFAFVFSEIYYASFAIFKFLVLGYSRDGDVVSSELGFLRLWLLQHFVFDANFNHGLTRWRGTEVISLKFRLLGMSVGSRVQIDNLQVVEHELVHIGDNVLFGSNSVYSNLRVGPKGVSKHEIRIHQFAATLDNTVLEAGCTMEEYSLAGSRSCIADSRRIPAGGVTIGCVDGSAMMLRTRSPDKFLPQTALEADALQRHTSLETWMMFNIVLTLLGFFSIPLHGLVSYAYCAVAAAAYFRNFNELQRVDLPGGAYRQYALETYRNQSGANSTTQLGGIQFEDPVHDLAYTSHTINNELLFVLLLMPAIAAGLALIYLGLSVVNKWIVIGKVCERGPLSAHSPCAPPACSPYVGWEFVL